MRRVRKIINALMIISIAVATGAWNCEYGETHPSAPQMPGPEQGGPRPEPPKVPKPAAGDPGPHVDELLQRVKQDPSIAIMMLIWLNERTFYVEYTTETGQRPTHVEVKASSPKGGTWVNVVHVRPGQTIGFTAGPVHMNIDANGTAQCYILHASGPGGAIADFQFVPRGPCATSYTIRA